MKIQKLLLPLIALLPCAGKGFAQATLNVRLAIVLSKEALPFTITKSKTILKQLQIIE